MPLTDLSRLLATKQSIMFPFMEKYLCSRINVPRKEIIDNLNNFNQVIDFCLKTRQRVVQNEYRRGKEYYSLNYQRIINYIHQNNWDDLQACVYSGPGVGQKIGSLILEVIIHYGEVNPSLEPSLFVPIDTHVRRVFTECLGLNNVPKVGVSVTSKKYIAFQKYLSENTANGIHRIVFDYLWFVGKIFCTKISSNETQYSKGYRLCSMCWIKEFCIIQDKWI